MGNLLKKSSRDEAAVSEDEKKADADEQKTKEKIPASCGDSEASISDSATNIEEVIDALEKIVASHSSEILKVFEKNIAYDTFKEEQIRQLHKELQSYKSDLLAKTMRPLVIGMIRIHEDIGKMVDFFQKNDEDKLERERILKIFRGFGEDIVTVLDQNGIFAYRESGEEFNPRRQRILRKLPTADSSLVGRVVESLRYGFEQGDTIIQKESVALYVLAEEETTESSLESKVTTSEE